MTLSLLDFFFPKRSLTGTEGTWVTKEEHGRLVCKPLLMQRSDLQKEGITSLDRLVAATSYADSPLLRKAIYNFKYQRIGEIHENLSRLLIQTSYLSWSSVNPVLCPVPLHWAREFDRGFNQSELLADAVARARGCSLRMFLTRIRPTGHQAWREDDERQEAVRNAFRVKGAVPPYIVLIDDIATTCATLDMCAKTLKAAGAKRVEALVLARG